ncbi:elongator complex protein 5 isoform X1 [Mycteria americana]|uniref:elongator complex protein 5 isoform X1 n=1 Tax=Mycteria americana TaxID=33587 RepID=UPI003F587692
MLEALVAGGAQGLVLVRDSTACEGRSLLRAFASAAVQRAERVLVVLFDVPREQFEAGLSPSVKQRLLYRDGFTDPLGWSGPDPDLRAGDFGGLLGGGLPPGGPLTLVLDSLSWLLLRLPPPRLCQALGALLGGPPSSARPSRLLALLHGDLHPPGLLRALGALASTQLVLGGPPPSPGAPRLASVLSRPRGGGTGRQKDESFTLLPDGSLRSLGVPPPAPGGGEEEEEEGGRRRQGTPRDSGGRAPPLTFRLRLSAAERAARAAVPPPYQLSPPRRSTLLQTPGTIVCAPEPPEDEDPEDPDDDLDV